MKRLLKWLGIVCLVLAGLVVASAFALSAYKKEILANINQKLQETVNGDVNIGDYNVTMLHSFPAITISLKNIYLRGPNYATYNRPFLYAEKVSVNLEILELIRKQVVIKSVDIERGEIFVFRTADGYTNAEVLKTRKAAGKNSGEQLMVVDLRKINLEDVKVSYQDSLKQKAFGVHFLRTENVLTGNDSLSLVHLTGNMTFMGLMVNKTKGSFLRNKNVLADLNVAINVGKRSISIGESKLIFDKSKLLVTGDFALVPPANYRLTIASENLDYDEGLSILPDSLEKKLSRYHVDRPVNIKVSLDGMLQPGLQPRLDVAFSFSDGRVIAQNVIFENTSITGTFMNHLDPVMINGDQNSRLKFTSLDGIFNSLPVKAVVTITDMTEPFLDLKATFNANLKELNQALDSAKLRLTDGKFTSSFTYAGKLREYLDDTRTEYQGRLVGSAKIVNGAFNYSSRRIFINKLNAEFAFTEKTFDIRRLTMALNKNTIDVTGTMTDYIPFFVSPETTGKVKLNIVSPDLDISGLIQRRRVKQTRKSKAASKRKMSDMVDRLNDELEFDLNFYVKAFKNKTFKASELRGNLSLKDDRFAIRNLSMNFAKGRVNLNLQVTDLDRRINPIRLQAKLEQVGLKQFFYAFNNFNQSTFRHEHIDGRLSLDLSFTSEVNDKLELLMSNLKGTARFKIQDGSLKNFEPMQRLSNFLLKGRDFSDVKFGEVGTDIALAGTKIDVSRMEIESTVLTMFIEGRYDMKDSSDLSIQVPLSNLKKRDQDIAPENIGVDAKAGASVFLRVRPDKNGKTAITYDPFKKLRRKKKNERDI